MVIRKSDDKPIRETLAPRWDGPIIVAATGESLTLEVAAFCAASGLPIVAVKQAVLRLPSADVLTACDSHHWDLYKGYPQFKGERWSTHSSGSYDNKREAQQKYGVRLVRSREGNTFSIDPSVVHLGNNSGFQAVGMAIHWLRKPGRIVLVGFDMQGYYFFGMHPRGIMNEVDRFPRRFDIAAEQMPEGVEIVFGTPSACKAFPMLPLEQALNVPRETSTAA